MKLIRGSITTGLACCVAIVCMAVATIGCRNENVDDYVMAVPADAEAVAAVRLDHILRKAAINNSLLTKMQLSALTNSSALGGAGEALAQFASNPSVSGLDFSSPAYFFKRGESIGLSLKVDDESMLDSFVDMLVDKGVCTRTRERNGMTWSTIMQEATMVWNDGTLLITYPADNRLAAACMSCTFDDSFAATDAFNNMSEHSGDDIVLYANASVMTDEMKSAVKSKMPAGARWHDMELTAGIAFEAGRTTISALISSTNPKIQSEIDRYGEALKPIGPDMVNMVPRGSALWMLMGADGPRLLEVMKSLPGIKEQLIAMGLGIDVEQMLRAVDGDVLIAMNDLKAATDAEQDETASVGLYARLANTDFMADVDYWKQSAKDYGIDFQSVGNDQYRLHADNIDAYWAVDNHTLYLGTSAYRPLQVEGKNAFASRVEGQKLFIMADLSTVEPAISTLTISSAGSGQLQLEINMKNKNENFLKQLPSIVLMGMAKMQEK
ncbi:MAG: DUF4836 family protein [Bacteroidaceae bacterium]|nr:DUF4836 family protein [Bacteroidaceae bacterium]